MMMTMRMKKIPFILVVCMLLFSTLDVLAQRNSAGSTECCFRYYTNRLPKNHVVRFQRTHIHCARDAVVFTMKNGHKLCVDPTQEWVQDIITTVESGQVDPVPTSAALQALHATESGDVRLVGGARHCAGRLEVKHQGEWRPVIPTYWGNQASSVVCRQLQCGSEVSLDMRLYSTDQPTWWITSTCVGSESSLRDCVTMEYTTSPITLEMSCSALQVQPTVHTTDPFSQCGRPEPGVTPRIIGGTGSLPGHHPWQVSLKHRTTGSSEPFTHTCGGVLIASCWVLTAAHCISPTRSMDMQVVLGGVYLARNEDSDQVIPVVRAIVHEDYRQSRSPDGQLYASHSDIALLQLNVTRSPLCAVETHFVKTACLPNQLFPNGKECVVSGWGRTGNNKLSNRLLQGKAPLISNQRCNAVYGDRLDLNMICAGYMEGGVDACQGDSGGPLMCEQDGIHYVAGLVSWGPRCDVSNRPGVYANVYRFVDWIKEKMLNDVKSYDYSYDDDPTSIL